jgi:D-hexose-6-phosphate mutarotase
VSELSWIRSATGEVCTQGAHVTRWSADGKAVLFLSRASRFAPGQAIRGGVPVIFPWFGDDPDGRGRSAHGFARRLAWRVVDSAMDATPARCRLALEDDEATRALWPHAFQLSLDVSFGDALELTLSATNRGSTPFRCEMALHTYLAVADVRQIRVRGLEDTAFIDKVDGMARKREGRSPIALTGETDRVYLGTTGTCVVEDPVWRRSLEIAKDGSRSTILWNPWEARAAAFGDLGDDEWTAFVCVESGNVADDALVLAPGQSHRMRVRLSVRK